MLREVARTWQKKTGTVKNIGNDQCGGEQDGLQKEYDQ